MSNRYVNTKTIKDENGIRRKETWIFLTPPKSNTDTYIRVTSPERLDRLAHRFYKNQFDWTIIAAANGLGKGTIWVKSNTVLRIPNINNISDYVTKINKER